MKTKDPFVPLLIAFAVFGLSFAFYKTWAHPMPVPVDPMANCTVVDSVTDNTRASKKTLAVYKCADGRKYVN